MRTRHGRSRSHDEAVGDAHGARLGVRARSRARAMRAGSGARLRRRRPARAGSGRARTCRAAPRSTRRCRTAGTHHQSIEPSRADERGGAAVAEQGVVLERAGSIDRLARSYRRAQRRRSATGRSYRRTPADARRTHRSRRRRHAASRRARVDLATGHRDGRERIVTPQPVDTGRGGGHDRARSSSSFDTDGPVGCTLPAVVVGGVGAHRRAHRSRRGSAPTRAALIGADASAGPCDGAQRRRRGRASPRSRFGAARGETRRRRDGDGRHRRRHRVVRRRRARAEHRARAHRGRRQDRRRVGVGRDARRRKSCRGRTGPKRARHVPHAAARAALARADRARRRRREARRQVPRPRSIPAARCASPSSATTPGIVGAALVRRLVAGTFGGLMQLGMVGLGRMGANLVRRLQRAGHQCVVYDHNPDAVAALGRRTARSRATSLADLVAQARRAARGVVHGPGRHHRCGRSTSSRRCSPRATSIIDGGNSYYRDDIARAASARRAKHRTSSTAGRAAASGASSAGSAS